MVNSQLLGLPPITHDDKLIYKALAETTPLLLKVNPAPPGAPPRPHENKGPGMIIGTSFALALVVVITCTRLWVRKYRTHAFGADDVVIIPAAIGCVAYLSINIATEAGSCLGQHVYDCTYQGFRWFYELAHCTFPIWNFTVFSIKISITLQNRRITGMTSRKWQIAHWTYFGILVCLLLFCTLINFFVCSTIQTSFTLQSWAEVSDPRSIKCLDQKAIGYATRALHIITDWFLLPVPIIIIWRLQMPLSRKIRLMVVFSVGVVSSVASIVRNVLTERIGSDVTIDYYEVYAWDIVDIFFATIVASLPALNGLVDQALIGLKQWSAMSSGYVLDRIHSREHSRDATRLSDKDTKNLFGNVATHCEESSSSDLRDGTWVDRSWDIELQIPEYHKERSPDFERVVKDQ